MKKLTAIAAAAIFLAPSAFGFQPREPAPIKAGGFHAPAKEAEHAAPAAKAAEKPAEKPKEAAKEDTHGAAPGHNAPPPAAQASGHGSRAAGPVYPVEVLKNLLEGNKRYSASQMESPNCDSARRAEVAQAQHPKAIIVSCSDSRVPPEIIFDQGVGDLFVVRTAGEVVDDVALGSIEYAVEHLHAKLILVLGHERCGAVAATLAGGEVPGHIGKIVEAITPAVEKGKEKEGDKLTNCIVVNAKAIAEKIRTTEPIISEHVKDGVVRVVGGYYDLDTGLVEIVYSPDVSL